VVLARRSIWRVEALEVSIVLPAILVADFLLFRTLWGNFLFFFPRLGMVCFKSLSNIFAGSRIGDLMAELTTKLDLILDLCFEIHIVVRRFPFPFALFKFCLCHVPGQQFGVCGQGRD
jgi:hypothetical protein